MDAMIDLETMGTEPKSAIVSIGVVIFDPRKGIRNQKSFYAELDWKNQGRKIDKSCYYEFWKKQDSKVKKQLKGKSELEKVLISLKNFLPKGIIVWGNGPTFDISILEDAYNSYLLTPPWKFWNIRDCRTVIDMYKSKRGEIGPGGFSCTNTHNALEDALNQAYVICDMWHDLLAPHATKYTEEQLSMFDDDIPF